MVGKPQKFDLSHLNFHHKQSKDLNSLSNVEFNNIQQAEFFCLHCNDAIQLESNFELLHIHTHTQET